MSPILRAAVIAVSLAAAPALAQPAPPAAPGMVDGHRLKHRLKEHVERRLFTSLSADGRRTMLAALRDVDRRDNRAAIEAARERMLDALDAARLDVAELKRAMDEERRAAEVAQTERQAALIAGFGQLSAADRRAFVAEARSLKARVEERVRTFRERRLRGEVPPPPPPPSGAGIE